MYLRLAAAIAIMILSMPEPTLAGTVEVAWTNLVKVTASGGSLKKTSGCDGCTDAGAVSASEIVSGDGYVEFVPTLGGRLFAGLGRDRSSATSSSTIDFAFSLWPTGTWDIRERGVYKKEGKFVQGDVFRVSVQGGVVRYYQNVVERYVSQAPPTYPLGLDTCFYGLNAEIIGATISGGAETGTSPAPVVLETPSSYDVSTDRITRARPPLPVIGGAGFQFTDPTFGSRLMRVTDGSTRPGAPDRSYRTPSAAHQNAWNTTSTYFYVTSTDGKIVPFAFDAATMHASRIQPTATGDGGLVLKFQGEPQFSYLDPNLLYGTYRGATLRTIQQYDFLKGQYGLLLDLDTVNTDLAGTYVGGVSSSSGPVEKIAVFYGGVSQDRHYRVVVFEKANPAARHVIDTLASTIDGAPAPIVLNFKLHHAWIDRSGRYVLLSTTSADRAAPRLAAPHYLWDTQTNAITEMPSVASRSNGHNALGFSTMLNQDCCRTTTWDAAQWQLRSLATPLVTSDIIAPVLQPKEVYLADHTSWNNARADRMVPFITGTYRHGNNTTAWRAWDEEILGVQTNAGTAGATVWRFAHHRSNTAQDADPTRFEFWYTPRVNVAQGGRWAIFTSNWEKTLGIDAGVATATQYRQDVFVVELRSTGTPIPPPNQPPTVSLGALGAGGALTAGVAMDLAADAKDNDGTIQRVDFAANGAVIGSATAVPFKVVWTPAAGSYQLTATAVDDDGASTTSGPISVTVVDNVQIVTDMLPVAPYAQPYALQMQAAGGAGSYAWQVTAGVLPDGLTLSSSGVLSGTTTATGTWPIEITVRDAADATRFDSRSYALNIDPPPNQSPTITLIGTVSGGAVQVGAPLTLAAEAIDSDGFVQRVDFFVNGTLVGSDTAAPFSVQWTVPSSGPQVVTAVAVDDDFATATSASMSIATKTEVVLYTTDVKARLGDYELVADTTAAAGQRLWNRNRGAAKLASALASPAHYAEFTFYAQAGRPYHLWVRGKADSNSWANDSMFAQFSGSVDASGTASDRIGTTDAMTVNLEDGLNAGLSGWGWQDNGYGVGVPGAPVYFETTGPQTIRIQPREDGLSIDQIVISPDVYLSMSPGALKNDATIVMR